MRNRDKCAQVCQSYGRLQLKVIEHVSKYGMDEAIAKSPVMLPPRRVAKELEKMLKDQEVQRHVGEDKLKEYEAQYGTWLEMCERLEDAGIPCSVVNVDLCMHNYARARKKRSGCETLFFDWGFACVAHPFSNLRQLRDVKMHM